MAAPQLLTRLDVLSSNLGSVSEFALQLETLTVVLLEETFAPFSTPMRFLRTLYVVDVEDKAGEVGHLVASLKFCPNLRSLSLTFRICANLIELLGDAFPHLLHLEYLALPYPPRHHEPAVCEAADYAWRMMCRHLTRLETLRWKRWVAKADAVELMPNLKSLRRFVQVDGGDDAGSVAWCFHVGAPADFKPPHWHGCEFIPNSQALIDFLLGLEDFFVGASHDYMSSDSPPYYWSRASLLKVLGRPAEPHLLLRNYASLFLDI